MRKVVRKTVKKAAPKKTTVKASGNGTFKLTYATMFDPPEEMHSRFEKALAKVKAELGKDHPLLINGQDRFVEAKFEDRSPINTEWLLGTFQTGSAQDAQDALAAARAAAPAMAGRRREERVKLPGPGPALVAKP